MRGASYVRQSEAKRARFCCRVNEGMAPFSGVNTWPCPAMHLFSCLHAVVRRTTYSHSLSSQAASHVTAPFSQCLLKLKQYAGFENLSSC